ncbi:unannotated protein [freshwater metagenome]|uniref:Unannotated protein n=1 Tax=freshwater metagenome TaxID=449393 RepID=A0A6J7HMN6_9ZZZZ|nr:hypothetical protein [Actinomycetota bacterium]
MGADELQAETYAALRATVGDLMATCEDLAAAFKEAVGDNEIRTAAITHPNMTDRAIEAIFLAGGEPSKATLALCDRPRLLMLWALSPRANVRALVASNPHTPAAILEELAEDRDESVRAVAVPNQPKH